MADITIYEHANFERRAQGLAAGRYGDALEEISIGNDTLSSLKVPQGLVEDHDFLCNGRRYGRLP